MIQSKQFFLCQQRTSKKNMVCDSCNWMLYKAQMLTITAGAVQKCWHILPTQENILLNWFERIGWTAHFYWIYKWINNLYWNEINSVFVFFETNRSSRSLALTRVIVISAIIIHWMQFRFIHSLSAMHVDSLAPRSSEVFLLNSFPWIHNKILTNQTSQCLFVQKYMGAITGARHSRNFSIPAYVLNENQMTLRFADISSALVWHLNTYSSFLLLSTFLWNFPDWLKTPTCRQISR